MVLIEGYLSKWTNMMKGWQYRYCTLEEDSGLLSYFTSKDKMTRGSRRGCVRLKGALIGIDDEDDITFTITCDQKTFHFQAHDYDERERWINALELTIEHHSHLKSGKSALKKINFDKKLYETDVYLQILIDQAKEIDGRIEQIKDEKEGEQLRTVKRLTDVTIESIKHSIVLLQVVNSQYMSATVTRGDSAAVLIASTTERREIATSVPEPKEVAASAPDRTDTSSQEETATARIPEMSYSSESEDEEENFYDASDFRDSSPPKPGSPATLDQLHSEFHSVDEEPAEMRLAVAQPLSQPRFVKKDEDSSDDDDMQSDTQQTSVIRYLLSQVELGMDLTKVTLPTFILERRSLLEMYGDFLAHADVFAKVTELRHPQERMLQVVKWYLSAFHAGRKSPVAKKPYNPILGELFRCYYDVGDGPDELCEDGPLPWVNKNQISFIAEQVSHHPPISAFYAEHSNRRISVDGYIWTKSKFLGLSIGVHMVGQAVLSVLDYDEEYVLTFPNGYGRSILTVPWFEMGGKVTISCAKTGYNCEIDFITKSFYNNKKHQVTANVFPPGDKRPFCQINGEWNGVLYARMNNGPREVFFDTTAVPTIKKVVRPLVEQDECESRKLWRDVTVNLRRRNMDGATAGKHLLEQRQREEARIRKETGAKWETKFFHESGEHWIFDRPLQKRLQSKSS